MIIYSRTSLKYTYHTPHFVGGGKERAKPWLEKSQEKYEAFIIDSPILPTWGAAENQALLIISGGEAKEHAAEK